MIAALNHTIVHAKDKQTSAAFLANVLGIEVAPAWGPFVPVLMEVITQPYGVIPG